MKPKPQPRDDLELFQAHFDKILNPNHKLVQLADKIDWSRFDVAFADRYSKDMGAAAKAVRLMVGLQYLKFTFNESDESIVDRWVENVYWQYFWFIREFREAYSRSPLIRERLRRRFRRAGVAGREAGQRGSYAPERRRAEP